MGRRSLIKKIAAYGEAIDRVVEADDNYISFENGTPHSQTQSAAAEVVLIGVAVEVKFSGILTVKWDAGFASNTNAVTVRHKLVIVPFVNPATGFSGGTPTGLLFGNDVGPDTSVPARSGRGNHLIADALGVPANGVEFNGVVPNSLAAGAQTLADTGATPTLAGMLSGSAMTFSGNVNFAQSTGPKVPFTTSTIAVPQFVVAALVLDSTALGDVVTYQYAHLSIEERPLS